MRRVWKHSTRTSHLSRRKLHSDSLVTLNHATIYQQHPTSDSDHPLFSDLDFTVTSAPTSERWAIISQDSSAIRTRFLHTLQGNYICVPPTARSWPLLASNEFKDKHPNLPLEPSRALHYVGFANSEAGAGSSGTKGTYLASRYESRREVTDWSLKDYLCGKISLNLSDQEIANAEAVEKSEKFKSVVRDLNLDDLLKLPVGNLSNGQTRRARIAKALIKDPVLLLLDEPFAGLDPANHRNLSGLLRGMADRYQPSVLLSLQATEPIPEWITHVMKLGQFGNTLAKGPIASVLDRYEILSEESNTIQMRTRDTNRSKKLWKYIPEHEQKIKMKKKDQSFIWWDEYSGPPIEGDFSQKNLVEMDGVKVHYGSRCVLGNWRQDVEGVMKDGLHWKVKQGERWGIFGANGSGKTTIISLLTSDHPQAYSLPLKLFGRSRLPAPGELGISVFDIQNRIGHSSPEVHTYFPKSFTVRQVLESAWAEAPYSRPAMSYEDDLRVASALRWFEWELNPRCDHEIDPVSKWCGTIARKHVVTGSELLKKGGKNESSSSVAGTDYRCIRAFNHFQAWNEKNPEWADEIRFAESSLTAQKVALFLQAVIKKPDILVLDEAFSGMNDASRRKCMMWLAHGEEMWPVVRENETNLVSGHKEFTPMKILDLAKNSGLEARQALICVSHREEEIPFVVNKWLHLPEANEGGSIRFGEIDRTKETWWADIWNTSRESAEANR